MYDIASLRLVIALAGVGVAALALLLKLFARKPKRAEKWEKAEIMKKLLALSEQDPALASAAPSVRLRARATKPGMRPSGAHMKAMTSTALPSRKTR
jgi:hypothetical protein